jgi:hypothetical protein
MSAPHSAAKAAASKRKAPPISVSSRAAAPGAFPASALAAAKARRSAAPASGTPKARNPSRPAS